MKNKITMTAFSDATTETPSHVLFKKAETLADLGGYYENSPQPNYSRAIVCYKNAIAIFEKFGERGVAKIIEINLDLFNLYMETPDYSLAIAHLRKAIELKEKFQLIAAGDNERILESKDKLYETAFQLFELGKSRAGTPQTICDAINNLKNVLLLYTFLGEQEFIVAISSSLGDLYARIGNNDEARRYFTETLQILGGMDMTLASDNICYSKFFTQHELGVMEYELYKQHLESTHAENARQYLQAAILTAYHHNIDVPEFITEAWRMLGKLPDDPRSSTQIVLSTLSFFPLLSERQISNQLVERSSFDNPGSLVDKRSFS